MGGGQKIYHFLYQIKCPPIICTQGINQGINEVSCTVRVFVLSFNECQYLSAVSLHPTIASSGLFPARDTRDDPLGSHLEVREEKARIKTGQGPQRESPSSSSLSSPQTGREETYSPDTDLVFMASVCHVLCLQKFCNVQIRNPIQLFISREEFQHAL